MKVKMQLRSVFLIVALYSSATNPVFGINTHDLDDIRNVAVKYVETEIAGNHHDIEIKTRPLDSRLKLPRCKQELIADTPFNATQLDNLSIKIRCNDATPWSIYVPLSVKIYQDILITRHALSRGDRIHTDDIELRRMEISGFSGRFLQQKSDAIGYILTRPLRAGQPVLSTSVKLPNIISRGQRVTLLSRQKNIQIRTQAESLMDAAAGERIRVKNTRSKRIIEGVVAKNGEVYVN